MVTKWRNGAEWVPKDVAMLSPCLPPEGAILPALGADTSKFPPALACSTGTSSPQNMGLRGTVNPRGENQISKGAGALPDPVGIFVPRVPRMFTDWET